MAFNLSSLMGGKEKQKGAGRPPAKTITQPQTLAECAALLKQQGAAVAVLAVQDLQAYWLRVMMDAKASTKDKLTASKLYAESVGAFDKSEDSKRRAPAVYTWGAEHQPAEDAEITQDVKQCSDNKT